MERRIAFYTDGFELLVALRHIEPPIWRKLRVPADLTLGQLHDVLQTAFGWTNSHLHGFEVGAVRFGMDGDQDGMFWVSEHAAPLGAVVTTQSMLLYRYDFGDDWEHEVKVERIVEQGAEGIVCLDGARACPPEDCGGPGGYERMLEALADPSVPEHREIAQWIGGRYDAEKFDLAAVNKKLATLSKRLGRGRRAKRA